MPVVDWDERRISTFTYSENDKKIYSISISGIANIYMTDKAREQREERLLASTLLHSKVAD